MERILVANKTYNYFDFLIEKEFEGVIIENLETGLEGFRKIMVKFNGK